MPENEAAAVQATSPKMSVPGRVLNVFLEPNRAFADIAAHPGWWVPMILLMAASTAYMAAFSSRVGWERYLGQQLETNKQTQDMPADQRERIVQTQAKFVGPVATVAAVVGTPISMCVIAGVMMFIFGTLLGTTVKFRQALGVVSHAFLPNVVATGAFLAVLFVKDPADFDVKNPAGFNLGFYLDPHTSSAWLVSLGSSIDVFSIWVILLLATGMAAVSRKSWKSSLAGVAAPWAVYVLLKVLWAAIKG
jgi:hypothetical protein